MLFLAEVISGSDKNTEGKICVGYTQAGEEILKSPASVVTITSANCFKEVASNKRRCRIHWLKLFDFEKEECTAAIEIPYAAILELSRVTKDFRHPLYNQIIDLRPEGQEQISNDYKNRTGMFAYMNNAKPLM